MKGRRPFAYKPKHSPFLRSSQAHGGKPLYIKAYQLSKNDHTNTRRHATNGKMNTLCDAGLLCVYSCLIKNATVLFLMPPTMLYTINRIGNDSRVGTLHPRCATSLSVTFHHPYRASCFFATFLRFECFPKKKRVKRCKNNIQEIFQDPCHNVVEIQYASRLSPTCRGIKRLIDFLYRFQISLVCMRQRPTFHNPVSAI